VALERRNKAWVVHKSLPWPLLLLFLTLMPAREAYEARAAREGVRGWADRVWAYAREAPTALRWRAEVRRRLPLRRLWPLLVRESLPYDGPGLSGRSPAARR
jgi:hypothetical protein